MVIDAERAFLKKEGVYEHLEKIVNRVIAEKPKDAYGIVEVLSRLIKEAAPSSSAEPTPEEIEVLTEHVKKAKLLDKVPASEDGEPLPAQCAVPNFVEEAEMFSWTGLGLGEVESYKVMCSLRNMATKLEGITKVRFWGKILGTGADYYVAEAAREGGGDAESEDMDAPGSGANMYTYFVTTDLAGSWMPLPDIKPQEIVAARQIRRLLTGSPKAKVITHPFFEGLEEVLLRAQIARITADTVLCVKGMLAREDEDPSSAIGENPEFVMPSPSELLQKGSWMHMAPHILNSGRTSHKPLPDPDEEPAAFAAAKEEIEADPPMDDLRDLLEDGLGWVVKQAGDTALYKNPADPSKPRSNAVTYVRSLTWPGAVCAVQRTSYANLYIGYGLRAGEPDFFPPAPPNVQEEPEDPGEAPEPQGTEEEEGEPQEDE